MPIKGWRAILLTLALSSAGGLYWDYRHTVDSPLGNTETVDFEIVKGESLAAIAENLHERGLVDKPYWFRLLAWMEKAATRLKYGEYEIPSQTTPRKLLVLFASGKVRQHSLALIEGWSFKQIVETMNRQVALSHHIEGKSGKEILGLIGAERENAEGLFFPDTYFFIKGASDLEMLKRAHRKMQSVLDEAWKNRDQGLPLHTPYEALILASLVERETARAEERAKIAGVFYRRLEQGMRLQTDPAVIHGLGDAYTGDLRKEDLLKDTPYNTYLHSGLPPTPIALPGADALRAALHPDIGRNLYFVARGDGSHVFSSTLAEHNKAVDQYQRNRHD